MAKKFFSYYKNLPFDDFIRKVCHYFLVLAKSNILNKIKYWVYLKNTDINCSDNISFVGLTRNVNIGYNFTVYKNCIFEFGVDSTFIVGNNCLFSYGVLISCRGTIEIGNDVQIGEYTSIRDTTHQYAVENVSMKDAPDITENIKIGSNVWIGRGCIILPGVTIGDGVVIGANSVVKGVLKPNLIYAGCPAKPIKQRLP